MKAERLAAIAAVSAACHITHAFRSHACRLVKSPPRSISASTLCAKKKKKTTMKEQGGSGGGRGFGVNPGVNAKPKYSLDDRSYGIDPGPTTPELTAEDMVDFFAAHGEWKPLFRHVLTDDGDGGGPVPPAAACLADVPRPDDLWDVEALERRRPWRLLPATPDPSPEGGEGGGGRLAAFLDEWQRSLLDIPLDAVVTGDNDRHFLEEGRRTIAVTRFHVLEDDDDDAELFRTCWSELAFLASQDAPGTGSLVLLPEERDGAAAAGGGERPGLELERARAFVREELLRPLRWLGRDGDFEVAAMERGSRAVRMLYRLGDIPDLSERDRGGDEDVAL